MNPHAPADAPSVSVIIPALNEQDNLRPTVEALVRILGPRCRAFEILIYDDGSTDATGERADALARRHPQVSVVHHRTPRGIGYVFRRGVRRSRMDYCVMIPGDDETNHRSIADIIESAGRADMVVTYPGNPEVRDLKRRLASRFFTLILNVAFRQRVRYYNGTNVYPRELLRRIPLDTRGPAYSASIVLRMLRAGATFVETPMHIKPRPAGCSKIFRWRNLVSVGSAVLRLLREDHAGRLGRAGRDLRACDDRLQRHGAPGEETSAVASSASPFLRGRAGDVRLFGSA